MSINTLTDRAQLLSGDSREIKFRVLQPGLITIRVTRDKTNPKTESGIVGSLLLDRPGSTHAVATAVGKVTDSVMLLQHQATAAEVAVPGDWTCEVTNDALDPLVFTTQIMGPVASVPLQSASIHM